MSTRQHGIRVIAALAGCGLLALAACSPQSRDIVESRAESRGTTATSGSLDDLRFASTSTRPGYLYGRSGDLNLPQSPGGG